MIDLYYWPTPNGWKISIALEELGLAYGVHPVNIGRGEQFAPEFLAISPNNRIPAIVDNEPADGGAPVSVFESGAILVYLAEKTGKLLPKDLRGRMRALEWTFWQVGGLGPMLGQWNHFARYAPEKLPYAIERYTKESNRLLGVLDRGLAKHAYLAGDEYTIADVASWTWAQGLAGMGQPVDEFPHAKRWLDAVAARPAVQKGKGLTVSAPTAPMDEEAKRVLFGQTAKREGEKK
jgi:GST-like protein